MPQTALAGSLASGYKAGGTSSPVSVRVPSGSLGVTGGKRKMPRRATATTCETVLRFRKALLALPCLLDMMTAS